jgi:hypothetical protein
MADSWHGIEPQLNELER